MPPGKAWENSGLFTIQGEWQKDGKVDFGMPMLTASDPDPLYRTHFYANVGHNGKTYRSSDNNLQLCVQYRSFVCRLPGEYRVAPVPGPDDPNALTAEFIDGLHFRDDLSDEVREHLCRRTPGITVYSAHHFYKRQQGVFIREHRPVFEQLAVRYLPYFKNFTTALHEALLHHADPHAKRALRIQGHTDIIEEGLQNRPGWLAGSGKIKLVMKKDECAKPKKPTRAVGDMSIVASLLGFVCTDMMKAAQEAVPFEFHSRRLTGRAEFIKKPQRSELQRVFDTMEKPDVDVYFAYFSDDSCLTYRWRGRFYYANVDISKCDASHSTHIFRLFADTFPAGPPREAARELVNQCRATAKVRSVQDPRRYVNITPSSCILYSGSTMTTAINNLACQLIIMAICEANVDAADTIEEVGVILERAILECGYIVTGLSGDETWCEMFEDVQFLKHSPVLDVNGRYRPLKNLGVLGRASGACRGDLPGRGDLKNRAAHFQYALLQGMYPRDSFRLLELMKKTALADMSIPLSQKYKKQIKQKIEKRLAYKVLASEDEELVRYEPEAVYIRYRLTASEIASLDDYGLSGYGMVTSSSAWDKIMRADYGLSTRGVTEFA